LSGSLVVPSVAVPPGDPDLVAVAAGRQAAAAERMGGLSARLRSSADRVVSTRDWCGEGSNAYSGAVGDACGWLDNAASATGRAASALKVYAAELRLAQDVARDAQRVAAGVVSEQAVLDRDIAGSVMSFSGGSRVLDRADVLTIDPVLRARSDHLAVDARRVAELAGEAGQQARAAAVKLAAALDEATAMTSANRLAAAAAYQASVEAAEDEKSLSERAHGWIDWAGFVPGLGAIPDVINGVWYLGEGNWTNAAISGGAAVPLVGDGAKVAIIAAKKAAKEKATRELAEEAAEHADEAAAGSGPLIQLQTKDSWIDSGTLDDHFRRHGAHFGAESANDYARMASEFFQRGGDQHVQIKIGPGALFACTNLPRIRSDLSLRTDKPRRYLSHQVHNIGPASQESCNEYQICMSSLRVS
jgi:hypothetical protein